MTAVKKPKVCLYCGDKTGPFHKDHLVPRKRGGPHAPENIVTACVPCNQSKTDMVPSEWREGLPAECYEIERVVIASMGGNLPGRTPRGVTSWKGRAISPGFLVLIETVGRDLIAGEVMATDATFVRVRDTSPVMKIGPKGILEVDPKPEPDEDQIVRWDDVYMVRTTSTPDHDPSLFWKRVSFIRKKWADPYDRCPFEAHMQALQRAGGALAPRKAAAYVNDVMETAVAIAKANFGSRVSPETAVAIYKLLHEKEEQIRREDTAERTRSNGRTNALAD